MGRALRRFGGRVVLAVRATLSRFLGLWHRPQNQDFQCFIDSPTAAGPSSLLATVHGWCFHRSGRPVCAVRASVGFSRFNGAYGNLRPDVERAFGDPAGARSGFVIPVKFRRKRSSLTLDAQLDDGSWHFVRTWCFPTPSGPSRTSSSPAVISWRLVAIAWRILLMPWRILVISPSLVVTSFRILTGYAGTWEPVHRSALDFLLAQAQSRGWHNIGVWRQYSPRPIAPERFPSRRSKADDLPRFVIVTPSYNQAAFVEATLRSVLDQRGVRVDYIVQDGGSTDGSVEVIRRVADEVAGRAPSGVRLARWTSERDAGQADAIRRGFQDLSGAGDDVMAYLNSDDLLLPGALRFVGEYFARRPEVDAVYGHRIIIDDAGLETGRWYTPRTTMQYLRLYDLVAQETLFWRRRLWDRIGGIDPSFQFALDWDFLLRAHAAGARMVRLPWFLGAFRVHSLQKTQARIEDVGTPEMNRLRLRELGVVPSQEEMQAPWSHGLLDSSLLHALSKLGIRA
jgi:hypothetical protein